MQADAIEPTREMIAFFERRTNEHIERVRRCLMLLAEASEYCEELIERGRVHDGSKFGVAERVPYIWLTEYHRCRKNGEPFEYPSGIAEKVSQAIHHHLTSNRHHPEFHADPNDILWPFRTCHYLRIETKVGDLASEKVGAVGEDCRQLWFSAAA